MDRKIKIYLEQGQNGVGSIFALFQNMKLVYNEKSLKIFTIYDNIKAY